MHHTKFKVYLGQERFESDAPIYDRDEPLEILGLWDWKELDINIPGNITKIQEATKVKFDLDVNEERIKLLTNLCRFKFSPSVFHTNDWQHMLCHNSKPTMQSLTTPNEKRKAGEGNNIVQEPFPINESTTSATNTVTCVPSSISLQKSLVVSQWLRRQLDDVSPHIQRIQEFLKTIYGIEEEDATLEKIQKMTETAPLSESPLASRTCRGLAAEATTEVANGIVPLRSRPLNLSRRFQTDPDSSH